MKRQAPPLGKLQSTSVGPFMESSVMSNRAGVSGNARRRQQSQGTSGIDGNGLIDEADFSAQSMDDGTRTKS